MVLANFAGNWFLGFVIKEVRKGFDEREDSGRFLGRKTTVVCRASGQGKIVRALFLFCSACLVDLVDEVLRKL